MIHNESLEKTNLEVLLKQLIQMRPGIVAAYEKQDWDRLRFIVGKLYKEWNTTQYYSLTKSLKTMSIRN